MVKNFLEWLGELEQNNSFGFTLVIFVVIFVAQLVIKLIFNASELFSDFWLSLEQIAFFSLGGALIIFYFAVRKKIGR